MSLDTTLQLTDKGIAAMRAGDHVRARTLLRQATQIDPTNQTAWLWLAGATSDFAARRDYLERVIALDPDNEAAREGLAEMGVAVAQPTPVSSPAPLDLPPLFAPPADSSAGKATTRLREPEPLPAPPPPAPSLPRGAEDSFLVEYVVHELRSNRPQSEVVREVADRMMSTWSEAEQLVAYVQQNQSGAIRTGNYWMYMMVGGLVLIGLFVLGGLYFFGKTLPPGVTPKIALSRGGVRGMFAVAAGVFTMMGAALDLDWFMTNRRAQFFVAMLGRGGARVFYGILGAVMVVLGVILMGAR